MGVLGSVWGVKALKDIVGADPSADMYDWAIKGGWTAVAIMGMLAVKPGNPMNTAMHTALLTAAVSGAVMLLNKAVPQYVGPYTNIGRAGPMATSARQASGGVRVIGRGPGYDAATPTYARPTATPTFAQAMPVATPVAARPTPSDVIQAF